MLLIVVQRHDVRVREIASATGITERYAYRILRDLEDGGYVERRRHGRCNVYRVNPDLQLGDRVVEEQALWELLRLIGKDTSADVVAMTATLLTRSRNSARRSRHLNTA